MVPDALFLDLDDTILEFDRHGEPSWRWVADENADRLNGRTAEFLDHLHRARMWFWSDPDRHRRGRLELGKTHGHIAGLALEAMSCPDQTLAADLGAAYSRERTRRMRPFPGALDTLARLRGTGLPMALLTNGDATGQRAKIERFELAGFFDCIVVEGEFGTGKPDPKVFEHALIALKAPRTIETWMVGDNLQADVAGAQVMGLSGIWVDWEGTGLPEPHPAHPPVSPHRTVRGLAELLSESDWRELEG